MPPVPPSAPGPPHLRQLRVEVQHLDATAGRSHRQVLAIRGEGAALGSLTHAHNAYGLQGAAAAAAGATQAVGGLSNHVAR